MQEKLEKNLFLEKTFSSPPYIGIMYIHHSFYCSNLLKELKIPFHFCPIFTKIGLCFYLENIWIQSIIRKTRLVVSNAHSSLHLDL